MPYVRMKKNILILGIIVSKEADKIFILDTGSTDNTFNLLKDKEKVTIKKK